MALYQRGGVWWLDVYHEGTRIRRSTGETDRRKAKAVHDALAAECHRRPRGRHTLADAIDLWRESRQRSRRDLILAKLLIEYHGDCDLADVTPESVRQGFGQMVPGSHNRYLAVLKHALVLAKRSGWLTDLPELHMKPGARQRTEWLTREEWERLRAELQPHHRAMADMAIATGLRLGACRQIEWRWVDLQRKLVTIPPGVQKNRKPLAVPLSAAAVRVLKDQVGAHDRWVFPGPQGGQMGDFTATFQRAAARAGVPWATFHSLRHTWASWHVQNGTPLEVLQKLGGWSSIMMLMRYAHLAPSFVAQWADNATQSQVTARRKPRAA